MISLKSKILWGGAVLIALTACGGPTGLGVHQIAFSKPPTTTTPLFSISTGNYSSNIDVVLTAAAGAVIHYTSGPNAAATPDPTDQSPVFNSGSPIAVYGNGTQLTVKAMAVMGQARSAVVTASYVINYNQVSTPAMTPPGLTAGDTYGADLQVTISSLTTGATIHYTVDGSPPDANSPVLPNGNFVPVTGDGTFVQIQAIAIKSGMLDSTITVADYTIDYGPADPPSFNIGGGISTEALNLSFPTNTLTAKVYYTTDGTDPAVSGTRVQADALNLTAPMAAPLTIRAIAQSPYFQDSAEVTETYAIPVLATSRGLGTFTWFSIAGSTTGQNLVAAAYGTAVAFSSDYGSIWTSSSMGGANWQVVSASSSGQYMLAAERFGAIRTSSSTGGGTWGTAASPTGSTVVGWYGLAGPTTTGFAVAAGGGAGPTVYTSTDFGLNWTVTAYNSSPGFRAIATSSNGDYILAAGGSSNLMVSTSAAASFTPYGPTASWNGVSVSGDGSVMAAVAYNGDIYYSTSNGTSWNSAGLGSRPWYGVAVSFDGTHIVAVGTGYISVSSNAGGTWTDLPYPQGTNASTVWQAVTSSQNGKRLSAAVNGGDIWLLELP